MAAGDLRVPELMKSRWAQSNVGGAPCYNYCTPSNRTAGCVATMAAQVMYYHKWPQTAVTFGKKNRLGADRWSYGYGSNSGRAQVQINENTWGFYEVWANELLDANGITRTLSGNNINGWQATVEQAAQSRYCDLTPFVPAFGGVYDWNNMVDDPGAAYNAGTLTDANRLAIGHLVRDVGITVPIHYEIGGGEGSAVATLTLSLVDTFQYADAVLMSGPTADDVKNILLFNLDAKLPVCVTIPGHAVVADGYGYADGSLYVHFNMGWGGGGVWYNPPVIYEGATLNSESYNTINKLIYNVHPHGTEGTSIVSGRLFDRNGNVVSNATVAADALDGAVTTDEKGIYALYMQPGESRRIVATNTVAMLMAETNITVGVTSSPYIYKDGTQNEGEGGYRTSVGNIWGVELVADKVLMPSLVVTAGIEEGEEAFKHTATVAFSCPTPGVTYRYTTDGSDPTESSDSGASVTIDATTTVKVRAYLDGAKPSEVASATFTKGTADTPESLDEHWIEENYDMRGLTGTWSPTLAYDPETKIATIESGDYTFTANTNSAGSVVTVDVTAKLHGECGEAPGNDSQAAVVIGTNCNFSVWTPDGWTDVFAPGVTPSADAEYTLRFLMDYSANTYSVQVLD